MNSRNQHTIYKGGAFHKEFESGKAFGKITVTYNSLHFEAAGSETELPLQGIHLKSGGANGKMLFFTHDAVEDCSIYTTDHAILDNPQLNSRMAIARRIAQIKTVQKRSGLALAAILLLILLFIFGLFKLKEPLVTAAAKRVPAKWEKTLGDAAFAQLKGQRQLVKNPELTQMMERITGPLFSRIPQERCTFTVHIMKNSTINAFALPGGHIVFHSGLLLAARSPEEVAGVLAHETAHVTLQHGIRQIIGSAGLYALVQTFFGDTSGLMAVILDNTTFLINQKYSRNYER